MGTLRSVWVIQLLLCCVRFVESMNTTTTQHCGDREYPDTNTPSLWWKLHHIPPKQQMSNLGPFDTLELHEQKSTDPPRPPATNYSGRQYHDLFTARGRVSFHHNHCLLTNIVVSALNNKGDIEKRLIVESEKHARNLGCSEIFIMLGEHHVAEKEYKFNQYKKYGYRTVTPTWGSRVSQWLWPDSPATPYMRKSLQ